MILRKNQFSAFDNSGLVKCARYAFMPNKLSFCGPDKNRDLFAYCQNQETDQGLNLILEKFQTLYPYLKFIAQSNQIRDPFDEKVVEAYWIGSYFLENIKRPGLYNHLVDGLRLKKKFNLKLFRQITDKIPLGAKPHHSFHVLSIWKKFNDADLAYALSSMDLCRISWGQIEKVNQSNLEVSYCPLIFKDDQLQLGSEVSHKISYQIDDQGFINDPQVGQWVSFHWNFACEILDNLQVAYLKKYTQENIQLANFS
ncbi:MAG: hypothetical protein CMI55_01975 [Parcubacteria group bacterium]|jgi:hypothetical protein|nr:hypothetical protein [Parcubacteria group bacterium]|tara:strand:+ start:554 stop:1318 length:765 start_codon:yes stop_codon:yes gene_type:complete